MRKKLALNEKQLLTLKNAATESKKVNNGIVDWRYVGKKVYGFPPTATGINKLKLSLRLNPDNVSRWSTDCSKHKIDLKLKRKRKVKLSEACGSNEKFGKDDVKPKPKTKRNDKVNDNTNVCLPLHEECSEKSILEEKDTLISVNKGMAGESNTTKRSVLYNKLSHLRELGTESTSYDTSKKDSCDKYRSESTLMLSENDDIYSSSTNDESHSGMEGDKSFLDESGISLKTLNLIGKSKYKKNGIFKKDISHLSKTLDIPNDILSKKSTGKCERLNKDGICALVKQIEKVNPYCTFKVRTNRFKKTNSRKKNYLYGLAASTVHFQLVNAKQKF